jgi:hypothetical protein
MPKITIHRNKDWTFKIGYNSTSEVFLDGQKIGSVSGGETSEFDVEPGQHKLKIKMGWYGSRDYNFSLFNGETKLFTVTSMKIYISSVAAILFLLLVLFLDEVLKIHLSHNAFKHIIYAFVLMVVGFQIFGRNTILFIKENEANNQKIHNKLPFISLILRIFVVLLSIFLFRNLLFPGKFSKHLNIARGVSSSNASNEWHYRFLYLDGTVQGKFTAMNDNTKLIYSSNIDSGNIVFQLYNSEDALITSVQANNRIDTLKSIFKKGGKYKIRASATKAKGHFDFKME